MKLLPKKADIDKFKAQERKREIDDGMRLAQRVDDLRRTKDNEEKSLLDYRNNAIKIIQKEIDQFLEERDHLEKQNNEARELRNELLKPLDHEWAELNIARADLSDREHELVQNVLKLDLEEKKIALEKEKISKIVAKSNQNEKETAKNLQEARSLKEMAHHEYEMASAEHNLQTENHEQAMLYAKGLQESYQSGLVILEKETQLIKEKEENIIIRENYLETQQKIVRMALEKLNYGTNDLPNNTN